MLDHIQAVLEPNCTLMLIPWYSQKPYCGTASDCGTDVREPFEGFEILARIMLSFISHGPFHKEYDYRLD